MILREEGSGRGGSKRRKSEKGKNRFS